MAYLEYDSKYAIILWRKTGPEGAEYGLYYQGVGGQTAQI